MIMLKYLAFGCNADHLRHGTFDKLSLFSLGVGTVLYVLTIILAICGYALLAIVMWVIAMGFIIGGIRLCANRIAICKALAGLENGWWHSSDDIQLYCGIRKNVADRIINGDFDDLLRDPLTCKFIG